MKCNKCGYIIDDNKLRSCPKCGFDFSSAEDSISKVAKTVLGVESAVLAAGMGATALSADTVENTNESISSNSTESTVSNNVTSDSNNAVASNELSNTSTGTQSNNVASDSLNVNATNTNSQTASNDNNSAILNDSSNSSTPINNDIVKEKNVLGEKINNILEDIKAGESSTETNITPSSEAKELLRKELSDNIDLLTEDNFDLSEFVIKKKCIKCGAIINSGVLVCSSCEGELESPEEYTKVYVDKDGNEYDGLKELVEKYPEIDDIIEVDTLISDENGNDTNFDFSTASEEEKIDQARNNANSGGGGEFYIDMNSLCYAINTLMGAKNSSGSIVASGWSVVSAAVQNIKYMPVPSASSISVIQKGVKEIFGDGRNNGFLSELEEKLKKLDENMKATNLEYAALWNKVNSEYMANFNELLDDEAIKEAGYTGMTLKDAWDETFNFRDKAIADIARYTESGEKFSDESQAAVDEYNKILEEGYFDNIYNSFLQRVTFSSNRSSEEEKFFEDWSAEVEKKLRIIAEGRNASILEDYSDFEYQLVCAYNAQKAQQAGEEISSISEDMQKAQEELNSAQQAYNREIEANSGYAADSLAEQSYEEHMKPYKERLDQAEKAFVNASTKYGEQYMNYVTSSNNYEKYTYAYLKMMETNSLTDEQKEFMEQYNTKMYDFDYKEADKNVNEIYSKLEDCVDPEDAMDLFGQLNCAINLRDEFLTAIQIRSNEDFDQKSQEHRISECREGVKEIPSVDDFGNETTIEIPTIEYFDENGNKISDVSSTEASIFFATSSQPDWVNRYLSSDIKDQIKSMSYLSENQLLALNYNFNTMQADAFANVYKNSLQNGNLMLGMEKYDNYVEDMENIDNWFDDDNWVANTLEDIAAWGYTAGTGAWDGIKGFFTGFKNLISPDGVVSADEYKQMLVGNYLNDTYDGNFMQGTYEISTSIGNMLPSIAVSFIPGVGAYLGTALMGISAAGNAVEQGYQMGYTPSQAYLYGAAVGLSEATLQYLLGGVTRLAKGGAGFVTRMAGKKVVADISAGVVERTAAKTFTMALEKYGMNMLSEGFEEGVQELLDPLFKNVLGKGEYNQETGEYVKASVDIDSVIKSFVYGAITAGIMEGGNLANEGISYARTGSTSGVSAVTSAIRNQYPDLGMFELLKEVNLQIKEMSNNGISVGSCVEQMQSSPAIQSAYDEYSNNTNEKTRMSYEDFVLFSATNAALAVNKNSIDGKMTEETRTSLIEQQANIEKTINTLNEKLANVNEILNSQTTTSEEKIQAAIDQTQIANSLVELGNNHSTIVSSLTADSFDTKTAINNLTEVYASGLVFDARSMNGVNSIVPDVQGYNYEECLVEQAKLTEQIKINEEKINSLKEKLNGNPNADELLSNPIEENNLLKQKLSEVETKLSEYESILAKLKESLISETEMYEKNKPFIEKKLKAKENLLEIKEAQLRNLEKGGKLTEKQRSIRTTEINSIKLEIKALQNTLETSQAKINNNKNTISQLSDKSFVNDKIEEFMQKNLQASFGLTDIENIDLNGLPTILFSNMLSNMNVEQYETIEASVIQKLNSMSTAELVKTLKSITNTDILLKILSNSSSKFMSELNKSQEVDIKSLLDYKKIITRIGNISSSIDNILKNGKVDAQTALKAFDLKIKEISINIVSSIKNLPVEIRENLLSNLQSLKSKIVEKFNDATLKLSESYNSILLNIDSVISSIKEYNSNMKDLKALDGTVTSILINDISNALHEISLLNLNLSINPNASIEKIQAISNAIATNLAKVKDSLKNYLADSKIDVKEKIEVINIKINSLLQAIETNAKKFSAFSKELIVLYLNDIRETFQCIASETQGALKEFTNSIIKIINKIDLTSKSIGKSYDELEISDFLDKYGSSYNATYGVNQGGIYDLVTFTYNKKRYSYRQAKQIVNEAMSEGRALPIFKKEGNAEYGNIKSNIMSKYGFTPDEASILLSCVDDVGACSYASVCNRIFQHFIGKEEEFANHFGFKMYKTVNGVKALNSNELLVDLYINSNLVENGGAFILRNENGYRLNPHVFSNKIDPLGRKLLDTQYQSYLSYFSGDNIELINNYLNTKGYSYDSKVLINSDFPIEKSDFMKVLDEIIDGWKNGKGVKLGIYTSPGHRINIKSMDPMAYSSSSTDSWHEGGGHSVFISGITESGFIVSSWGQKYLIPFNDLISGGRFVLTQSTIV